MGEMSRCESPGEDGGCILGTGRHLQHYDGTLWWDNPQAIEEEARRPRRAHSRGRRRDPQSSGRARDLISGALSRTTPEVRVATQSRPREWTEAAWKIRATEILDEFLAARTEPFTTPEDVWPLLPDPLPAVDRRIFEGVVSSALRTNKMVQQGGYKELRGVYHTADGGTFKMNKPVRVYVARSK